MRLALALALALSLLSCGSPPKARPSVLVFTLDTLRADALGIYGNRHKPSPRIDAIGAQGYRFSRAYTVTPLTIPAHSSLFTSLWPPRHGVQDNGDFFLDEGATTLAELMQSHGYETMASVGAEVTSHHWGFAQGFDAFFDEMGSARESERNRWRVERSADEVVRDATGWFDARADKTKPFFAWLHMFDVHAPYAPPEPYLSQQPDRPYLGEVAWTDAQVGGFLDHLEASGALENTWVFILADHGEGRGSHGEALHGTLLYNSTTRIPFIVRPPKGDGGGARLDFPTSIVDVFPTVLSLAGIDLPEDIDGIDLSPWLRPSKERPEELKGRSVFIESLYAYRHYGWAPQKAMVTDDFKLIDSTTPELYAGWDLAEREDLASTAVPQVSKMKTTLGALTAAMVTRESTAERAELSAERIAQLEALGYVTSSADPGEAPAAGLPDPVARLGVLRKVEAARQAFQSGDLDEAETRLAEVLAAEPTFVDMRVLQANLLLRRGEHSDALAAARALDEEHPSTQIKSVIANIHIARGHLKEAADMFALVIDIDPYLTGSWKAYLHTLFLSGQIPRLDEEVQRAKTLVPDIVAVQVMEGIVRVMRDEIPEAEALLLGAMEREPNHPFVNHSMGIIRRSQGKPNEAEQFLLEEIRLHPPAVPARRTLVEVFAEQRRYAEQLEQLAEIEQTERPNVLTVHSRAQALFNLERYAESHRAVKRCAELDARYPGCVMLSANVLQKLGREEEAKAAYARALDLVKERQPRRGPTGPRDPPPSAPSPPE